VRGKKTATAKKRTTRPLKRNPFDADYTEAQRAVIAQVAHEFDLSEDSVFLAIGALQRSSPTTVTKPRVTKSIPKRKMRESKRKVSEASENSESQSPSNESTTKIQGNNSMDQTINQVSTDIRFDNTLLDFGLLPSQWESTFDSLPVEHDDNYNAGTAVIIYPAANNGFADC
jgi:hypothetical protein